MASYVQVSTGEVKQVGPARLYTAVAPSPDGKYLLVAWLERPFSYNVPCGRFPKRIQLWDRYCTLAGSASHHGSLRT